MLMLFLVARTDDINRFPRKILDAGELTRKFQILFEMVKMALKGLGLDCWDTLCPE